MSVHQFFNDYFHIQRMLKSKKEYKQQMARVDSLPEAYRLVFRKIQGTMWQFTAGAGYDMMKLQGDLLELFEEGAAMGKHVLEVTGDDVAGFVEELLKNVRTRPEDWKTEFNREILEKVGKMT